MKIKRKIVKIDEDKCNGCGLCVPKCAEGALQIVNGKARLVSEAYCDGLGACLGECPQGAITLEEREAEGFDEKAAKHHLAHYTQEEPLPCGCSGNTVQQFHRAQDRATAAAGHQPSTLAHWPVQLTLVPPQAPFLQGAEVLLTADCVPFAYGNFHQDFLEGHALLVACPKLDNFEAHVAKLTDILHRSEIKSITVVHMEVPCCSGLVHMAKTAIRASGKDTPLKEVTISTRGDLV